MIVSLRGTPYRSLTTTSDGYGCDSSQMTRPTISWHVSHLNSIPYLSLRMILLISVPLMISKEVQYQSSLIDDKLTFVLKM